MSFFTPDPSEYNESIHATLNNTPISNAKNPKILWLSFDPKLDYETQIYYQSYA